MKTSQVIAMLILPLLLSAGVYSCKKNRFKKEVFLEELYQYKIEPEIRETATSIVTGINSWEIYSTDMNEVSLSNFKSNFTVLMNKYESVSFYNLGDVGATYVFSRMYKTTIDTVGIIENYNSQDEFTKSDIGTYTNTERGIFALEYLLFSPTLEDSLESIKFVGFVEAHLQYLESVSADFASTWNIYQQNFINNNEGGVTDSYNIVVNRIIHVLEDLIVKRISKPVAENDPSIGVGYHSNRSLQNIKTQLIQLNEIYLGTGTEDFNSVYNNVRKKNRNLADDVTDKFEEIISYGNSMSYELAYYITSDQITLEAYSDLLIELLGLFKIDVQQELDIILTFGDTDGD